MINENVAMYFQYILIAKIQLNAQLAMTRTMTKVKQTSMIVISDEG